MNTTTTTQTFQGATVVKVAAATLTPPSGTMTIGSESRAFVSGEPYAIVINGRPLNGNYGIGTQVTLA